MNHLPPPLSVTTYEIILPGLYVRESDFVDCLHISRERLSGEVFAGRLPWPTINRRPLWTWAEVCRWLMATCPDYSSDLLDTVMWNIFSRQTQGKPMAAVASSVVGE